MGKVVHVAVGVIVRNNNVRDDHVREQEIFLTKRLKHAHQGGKWEFPGGKVEENETVAEALSRELKEEVDIEILACIPLIKIEHDYGDKKVLLEVFIVDNFLGEPSAQEGQEQSWFPLSALTKLNFPEANKAIIKALETFVK